MNSQNGAISEEDLAMRIRLVLLLVPVVLLAGFAALNWSEFVRPTMLSWGWGTGEAPLGLILLALLALSWIGFLLASAYLQTHYQLAAHRTSKVLEAQRELADKAEASRFTELRTYLESQALLAQQREAAMAARLERAVHQDQQVLLAMIERLSTRMGLEPDSTITPAVIRHEGHTPH